MTFKKFLMTFLLSLTLLACVPSQATPAEIPATEIPATEATVATEEKQPTPIIQRKGEITFEYNLTDVLPADFFGGTYVKSEKISYYREGTTWPIKNSSLKLLDLGPLYQVYRFADLSNKVGNCGINTYPEDENTFPVQFQPVAEVCNEILKNETASITFGLSNCDVDLTKTIYCQQGFDTGVLKYRLNHNLDKFQFLYTGEWNYNYPVWINQALTKLGFKESPDMFFDIMTPGANYTIYKNPGGE